MIPAESDRAMVDRFREEFVHRFQYRFHKFSDHYSIVAMFAAEKVKEALDAQRNRP